MQESSESPPRSSTKKNRAFPALALSAEALEVYHMILHLSYAFFLAAFLSARFMHLVTTSILRLSVVCEIHLRVVEFRFRIHSLFSTRCEERVLCVSMCARV